MKVLIGCEYSGAVRRAFREMGHDAWSCDIIPSDDDSPFHLQKDVRTILDEMWDMAIFHPPCTFMSNSGAKHLYIKGKKENGRDERRFEQLRDAALFFKHLMDAPINRVALENPIMLSYAVEIIGKPFDQIIQPYQFGHNATKTTCLWLKNLPFLVPTNIVDKGKRHLTKGGKSLPAWYNLPPSPDRGKKRSRTFEGIAEAMAVQWGNLR